LKTGHYNGYKDARDSSAALKAGVPPKAGAAMLRSCKAEKKPV